MKRKAIHAQHFKNPSKTVMLINECSVKEKQVIEQPAKSFKLFEVKEEEILHKKININEV